MAKAWRDDWKADAQGCWTRLTDDQYRNCQKPQKAKEQDLTYDEIRLLRQKEAYPIIREFEKWMLDTACKVVPGSRIMKAIKYTYSLLPRLSRYVNDGRYKIDDNLVENAIRPLAISRKNFLFCGNHDAAIRASIVFSLIGSCKALGINPREWMEDIPCHTEEALAEDTDTP